MILFRHADPRFPFLWETASQPTGRWHTSGEGPVHYLADTPDGAWAEFLRHEEIQDSQDLAGIRRALWVIEIPVPPETEAQLPERIMAGSTDSYAACQKEARRLRAAGETGFRAPSAALLPEGACGWIVREGLREGPSRDGQVYVLFGRRPDLVGWPASFEGRPPDYLLDRVRNFDVPVGV